MDLFIFSPEQDITPDIVSEFIDAHRLRLARYERLRDLYESNAPILSQAAKAAYKPDNRLVANFSKYITDTFNGYFLGVPLKVQHDDEKTDIVVDDFLTENDMDDNLAELAKLTSIYGHAYEYLFQDEDTVSHCTYNSPLDMFLVHDDSIQQAPLFAVRYSEDEDGSITGQLFTKAQEIAFTGDSSGVLAFTAEIPHYFGDVPIIEYIENEERQSIFESVETLINAYDRAISSKANDVDYFSDAYMKIFGVEIDETTLNDIRDNRIINLFGQNSALATAEFMAKPDGAASQEQLLDRIEDLIYKISMVSDINDESFGDASGIALEFKLQPMKNLASMKERKFASGMNRRFRMLFAIWGIQRKVDPLTWRDLNYKFTRNLPRNLADEAETAAKLEGIVSKETQLKILSIVDNPQQEISRMEEENPTRQLFDMGAAATE
jgi:SPP1 family phage portal protein